MIRLPTIFVSLLAHLFLIFFIAGPAPCQETSQSTVAAKAVNAFAVDLYGQLRKTEGNLFFSPYSVSAALAIAYTGAAGNTESQMAKVLHFNLDKPKTNEAFRALNEQVLVAGRGKDVELNIANALWAEKSLTFKKEFLESVRGNYQGSLQQADFRHAPEAARKKINSWVEEQTKDKIKDLLGPGLITSNTKLVITNAIYFKGFWESQFKKNWTKDDSFYLLDGAKVTVPMMSQTASFGYTEEAGLQVLEMPYKGEELTMVVLLPSKDRSFEDFERSLTIEKLGQWIGKLRTRTVVVYFPKYKMTRAFQLPAVLKKLGMTDAFSMRDANFSGMTRGKDFFIGQVVHKAFVDVYEEGTEAAAATGVVMKSGMFPRPKTVFRADHPFIFLIRHKPSGCILFLGRVTKP
jgi:serine protease inhibitor